MFEKSRIDQNKLEKVPSGMFFEYKDVVNDSFSEEDHTEDGLKFKEEVLNGEFEDVILEKNNGSRLVYRKK